MITLPAHCSTMMAPAILSALIELADHGTDVVIDGAEVDNVGQAMLQLLVCARSDAEAAGRSFTIMNPSEALVRRAALCRLDAMLGLGAVAPETGVVS